MAFKLNQPKSTKGQQASDDQAIALHEEAEDGMVDAELNRAVPLERSRQQQMLGVILLVLIAAIGALFYYGSRQSAHNTAYVATAGELRMLSQRLAKASSLALRADQSAFTQLRDSHDKFELDLERLKNGGDLFDLTIPPSPESVLPQLQQLETAWAKVSKNTAQLRAQEKRLAFLGMSTAIISKSSVSLQELTEQLAAHKIATNASAREVAAANQMTMLIQRIVRNSDTLWLEDTISAETVSRLDKDTSRFRELLTAFAKGSDSLRLPAASDEETRRVLVALETAFRDCQKAVTDILGSMQDLFIAKEAGAGILVDNEVLLEAANSLASAYQMNASGNMVYLLAAVLVIVTVIVLVWMSKVYRGDIMRRREQLVEKGKENADRINRKNQAAILRLMNELGNLADGDLTVAATVSEEITGAIADSINYTIEELRVLVGRINDAASRVTMASAVAQQTSVELLEAARRQSQEIQEAGRSVLEMASSMTRVSSEANQSAQVARQSLAAAGKGTEAVQASIKGMDGIRDQIQETSKRIKRLGESSQEIGEIVELISDITEQTNVLALNAAIQAASAGDAGRGFTVVAEEVQRLAERSGEATKQIAAIVRTIQKDTQGAVSAMEESTRGVVDGAKLSDAAGQALAEIGDVSQSLAELIEKISRATRQQATAATGVAGKMQGILKVTEQTTAGTQRTASAIGELAGLATELKGSVAGFKVS